MKATYAWFNRNAVINRVLTMQCSALAVLLFAAAGAGHAAPPQQTRQLWDTEFVSASQPDKKLDKTTHEAKPQKPRYKAKTETPQPLKQTDSFVGITIWRLRPAQPGDEATLSDEGKQFTPQRVESETALKEGDLVRLTIEAPKEGYLYVIDREQYSDNSLSEPYLIFPVRRIRGGDNTVKAGRIIEIPDQTDNPPYFTLRRSKPGQTAELISVVVSPKPLPGVRIGPEASRGALKLSEQQVAAWELQWDGEAERFELEKGAGKPWTKAEQQAGLGTRLLVQEEPMPQTLYRVPAEAGEPILVKVPLLIVE